MSILKEQDDLVSIGMPVYNDKQFLHQAINSLLAQTYRNFELIISDDCSTDGSSEICKDYANKYNNINYIRQKSNIGISRNMKFLLNKAKGKYFMWAANDDLWHPDFIATLHKSLAGTSSISAFCPMIFIGENGAELFDPVGRATDYSGRTATERLKKLINIFDDCFGYGLFRRNMILDVQFPTWWWVNRTCPYNNIYPTLCFYLTKGNFQLVESPPLWYNRLKEDHNIHHKIPYNHTFIRGTAALSLRKFNLVYKSMENIIRADKSIFTAIRITPLIFYKWFLIPSWNEFRRRLKLYLKNKLKLF